MRITSLFLFSLLFLPAFLTGQTTFHLGVGWDNAKLERGRNFALREGEIYLTEQTTYTAGYFFRAAVEQKLSSSSSLSLAGIYLRPKDGGANFFGFVIAPIDRIHINSWAMRTVYRKIIYENFYLGGGFGIGFYALEVSRKSGPKWDISNAYPNNVAYDLPLFFGYRYRKIRLEAYYNYGLGFRKDYSELMEPLRSFGFSVNYNLLTLGKKRRGFGP